MCAFIRVIFSNVLLLAVSVFCCSGLAFAKTALRGIKLPFPQNVKQVPGLEYHGMERSVDTITNSPQLIHSATLHFQKDYNKIISVPFTITRSLADVVNPENISSEVEAALFTTLDTLSKYRDPLTTTLLLTRWTHYASVEESIRAELHQKRYDSPVNYEFFYKDLASYHETVLDTLIVDDEFRTEFGNEVLIKRAMQHPDKSLARFRNLLDAQVVPIKDTLLGYVRMKWKTYLIHRKFSKLPRSMQDDLDNVLNLPQGKDMIDAILRHAYLRKSYTAIHSTIAEKLPHLQQPSGITAEELKKFAELDQQLWSELYIFQKSIAENGATIVVE